VDAQADAGAGVAPVHADTPPRTLTCARDGDIVRVSFSGPVSPLVVGAPPSMPVAIKYGSDKGGWTDFGYGADSPKAQTAWGGEADETGAPRQYALAIPADAGRFNLYLLGVDGSVAWFDLPDADRDGDAWQVQGDCHMDCRPDSCALSF
jgi:hypothetical protein